MDREAVYTPLAPGKPAITSQALKAVGLVFTAGVIPTVAETGRLCEGGVAEQTHQTMRNLKTVLEAAGSSLDRLLQVTVYLRHWADFPEMNVVYLSYLRAPLPARNCVEVSYIGDDAALEIVAIALAGEGGTSQP